MNPQDHAGQDIEPLTMSLWPDAGRRLGLSRNGTYDAARRGEIPGLMRFGRIHRVSIPIFTRAIYGDEQAHSRDPRQLNLPFDSD